MLADSSFSAIRLEKQGLTDKVTGQDFIKGRTKADSLQMEH
jgi:hypothetical protein